MHLPWQEQGHLHKYDWAPVSTETKPCHKYLERPLQLLRVLQTRNCCQSTIATYLHPSSLTPLPKYELSIHWFFCLSITSLTPPSLVHPFHWSADDPPSSPGRQHVCNVTFCHIISWWQKRRRVHHNDGSGNENRRMGKGCDTDKHQGGGGVITQVALFTQCAGGCLCLKHTHTQLTH